MKHIDDGIQLSLFEPSSAGSTENLFPEIGRLVRGEKPHTGETIEGYVWKIGSIYWKLVSTREETETGSQDYFYCLASTVSFVDSEGPLTASDSSD